jgi:DNA-binding response OmpR family regulator
MKHKILIVDDDYFYRRVIQNHFSHNEALQVIMAKDGLAALSVLLREKISCIITDYHLPDKTADQILRDMHTYGIYIPTIVVTADESLETERIVRSNGADYFFVKPLDMIDMETVVTALLQKNDTVSQFNCLGEV